MTVIVESTTGKRKYPEVKFMKSFPNTFQALLKDSLKDVILIKAIPSNQEEAKMFGNQTLYFSFL